MSTVSVRITKDAVVEEEVAAQLCDDFANWLDDRGYCIIRKTSAGPAPTEWDYETLSADFARERAS